MSNYYEYVLNKASGKIHRTAVIDGGPRLTSEMCNLDDMEEKRDIEEGEIQAFLDVGCERCQHCFKEESDA